MQQADLQTIMNKFSALSTPSGAEFELERRFAVRNPLPKAITYSFTDDIGLAHQYYQLRESIPINVWGMDQPCGKHDAFDAHSEMLIAHRGRLCIGGARLTVSSCHSPAMLPMEGGDLRLQKLFPELDLHETTYCEFSRFAALPDYQAIVIPELSRLLIQQALSLGAEYAFILAPASSAAGYCETVQQAGFHCSLRGDMAIADEMALCIVDLSKQARFRNSKIKESALIAE